MIAAGGVVLALVLLGLLVRNHGLARYFLVTQDFPVLLFAVASLVAMAIWARTARRVAETAPRAVFLEVLSTVTTVSIGAVALVIGSRLAHDLVLHGLALSRDEQMALFDAAVFGSGRLAAPLPLEWRDLLLALNTVFMIEVPGHVGWVSSYLPVNAMLRAAADSLNAGTWLNPALAALGLWATWRVSLRLFPDSREAVGVAMLLYLTSTQVWAAAATSYAMTGHLALNMVWLLLYLRGGPWHAGAIGAGAMATGLHQLVFHPLFAAPFVALLAWRRRWTAFACYVGGYAVIGLLWASWARLPLAELGVPAATGGPTGLLAHALELIGALSFESAALMGANLARFLAWQNLFLVPLLLAGAAFALRSRKPMHIALLASLLATPAAVFMLLAYQGHGWGYRYMHGLIGIGCLIGALGWREMRALDARAGRMFAVASLATVGVAGPFLLWRAHAFVEPYAEAHAAIAASEADVVLVDSTAAPFAIDLAINTPDLDRPVRLVADRIGSDDLTPLCRSRVVAQLDPRFYDDIALVFGAPRNTRTTDPAEVGADGKLAPESPRAPDPCAPSGYESNTIHRGVDE